MGNHESEVEHYLLCHPDDVVDVEARNGLLQFDEVRRLANQFFASNKQFKLMPEVILELHRQATQDIYADAGCYRKGTVSISGTDHQPPPAPEVQSHMMDMVAYVNDGWDHQTPLHLCSYLMWRCNWIHPFSDGNGRTTRALSYLVFLIRLGYEPGGVPTFVDMIAQDKLPYYHALDAADAAWKLGALDVSSMEDLLTQLLAKQLTSVIGDAAGIKL